MEELRRRWPGLLWAGGVTVLTAILAHRAVRFGQISTLTPIATGIFAAVCGVATAAYRDRRDPALLLVATGAGTVAAQYLLWVVLIPLVWADPMQAARVYVSGAVYGSAVAALVLTACLALTVPWQDRRGRPPLQPRVVAGAAAAVIGVVDLLLIVLKPAEPEPAFFTARAYAWPALAAMILWLLVVVAAAAAVVRTVERPGWFRWIAGGAAAVGVAAIGTALTYLVRVRWVAEIGIIWQLAMLATGAALLLGAVLAVGRADVTRMRRASDRAAEVLSGRSEIASVIAHDVRGPASSIKSIASSLRSNYDRLGDPERLEFVGMVEHEAARLLQLVGQMSLALKVDAGSLDYQRRVQPVGPIVTQAVNDAELTEHAIEVDVSAPAEADVDARWLAESIGQGLDNAAKFSPEGSPMRVAVLTDQDDVVIQIADEGPGVPPEVRAEVFQKFARWRPPGYEDRPGSGLGLFIARSIARELGGDVVLASAATGGTILRIRIPRKG